MLRILAACLFAIAVNPVYAQETPEASDGGEPSAAPTQQTAELPPFNVSAFKLNTTDDLIDICGLPEEHPDFITAHAFCIGFVTATVHYHREIAAAPGMRTLICPDRPIPRDMLINVFLAWSKAHPGETQSNAVISIIKAASDKWPCRG